MKLGQHFLKSKEALRQIIAAAELSADDTVLEVGPGKGVLTEELLKHVKHIVAVEKDPKLLGELEKSFEEEIESGKLELLEGDILDFEITDKLHTAKYKVVANLPYYITGEFIRSFLTSAKPPAMMVLLVQKEVAERIVARDGKESLLSLSVKAYGAPRYVGKVAARYFSPPPAVDSAIIAIKGISKEFFRSNELSEEEFFELLRFCFRRKRKRVLGSIAEFSDKSTASAVGEKCEIADGARPEELTLEEWCRAVKIVNSRI